MTTEPSDLKPFLDSLENFTPTIPGEIIRFYLEQGGFQTNDPIVYVLSSSFCSMYSYSLFMVRDKIEGWTALSSFVVAHGSNNKESKTFIDSPNPFWLLLSLLRFNFVPRVFLPLAKKLLVLLCSRRGERRTWSRGEAKCSADGVTMPANGEAGTSICIMSPLTPTDGGTRSVLPAAAAAPAAAPATAA